LRDAVDRLHERYMKLAAELARAPPP